ncbi:hypothetical protein C8Q70DRAFT_1057074 [Cubamyces menziesii]|nr:hypothetical protein C8Q70DRAFT_1057074 [Cubamyces menziesii]
MAVFNVSCESQATAPNPEEYLGVGSNPDGDSEASHNFQHAIQELIENLDQAERRWDTRFAQLQEQAEYLVRRHEDVGKHMRDSKCDQESTSDRIIQLEDEVLELREVVSELSRSVGSTVREAKEHRRQVQKIVSESRDSLRADIHELQQRLGTLQLDATILKSQRTVDRARTERVEYGMSVLEATDSTIRHAVQRLERDLEDLSNVPLNYDIVGLTVDEVSPAPRTLADELECVALPQPVEFADDTEKLECASRPVSPLPPFLDHSTMTRPSATTPNPAPLVDDVYPTAPKMIAPANMKSDLAVSVLAPEPLPHGLPKSSEMPPATFTLLRHRTQKLALASLLLVLSCLLSSYGLPFSARYFGQAARRPIWEKSREE